MFRGEVVRIENEVFDHLLQLAAGSVRFKKEQIRSPTHNPMMRRAA